MNTKQIKASDLPEMRKLVEDMVSSQGRFQREFEAAEDLRQKERELQSTSKLARYSDMLIFTEVVGWLPLTALAKVFGMVSWIVLPMAVLFVVTLVLLRHCEKRWVGLEDEVRKLKFPDITEELVLNLNKLLWVFDISKNDLPSLNSGKARESLTTQALRILKAQEDVEETGGLQGEGEVSAANLKFKAMFDASKYFGFIAEDQEYGPFFREATRRLSRRAPVK